MSPITSQCASCGAQITFRVDEAVVTVCEYCNTVNARTDRGFEDLGKVADLVDSQSPLKLWLEGKYDGVGIFITGRAQVRHAAGGMWDEWYVKFDDGRWGWLAEAQGKFYLTFKIDSAGNVPSYNDLSPGDRISAGGVEYVVAERGVGEMLGAEGDIPYRVEPGRRFYFADLESASGEFSTIDYSDDPVVVYAGRQVTLAELGIAANEAAQEVAARDVSSAGMVCPNCNGSLELRAPDRSERVACPYCDSLLDVNQGNLIFLKLVDGPKIAPTLPLGSTGVLPGVDSSNPEDQELTVIGFMRRSVSYFGTKYFWDEYLLYNARVGFRWLTHSDGHWSYVQPLSVAKVEVEAGTSHYTGQTASYEGTAYRVFQDDEASVEYVSGEFYWRVEAGQVVTTCDYVSPPYMISQERTADELSYSLGSYVTPAEVGKAFGVELEDRRGDTVAPNQPYPYKGFAKLWGAMLAVAVVAMILVAATRDGKVVFEKRFVVEAAEARDKPTVIFSEPFTLKARQNLEIQMESPVSNSWVYVLADLFSEDNGVVEQFDVPIEYYRGVSGGEAWSEGSQRSQRLLGAVPTGRYSLRLSVERKEWAKPVVLAVRVREGVFRWRYAIFLLIGLTIIPLGIAFHAGSFEKRRWKDSDYSKYASSEDD